MKNYENIEENLDRIYNYNILLIDAFKSLIPPVIANENDDSDSEITQASISKNIQEAKKIQCLILKIKDRKGKLDKKLKELGI